MIQAEATRVTTPVEVLQRRRVLLTCIVATCARNLEPPFWIYRTPATDAFNQASNEFGLRTGLFSLSLLGIILLGGILGDLAGRRRVLLIGLGGLVVAHLLLPLSPAAPWFIFTRILSGGFGAVVPALSLSLLYLAYIDLPEARARAVAVYVLITSTAFLLSGSIASLTFRAFGWQAPTLLPTLLGVAALLLGLRILPESRARSEHHSDVVGYSAWALVALGSLGSLVAWLGSGIYATIGMMMALAGLVIGSGLLAWWSMRARRSDSAAIIQVKRRALLILITFGFAMQFGFVGYVVQVRQVLMQAYGYHPVLATIALAPLLLGMLLMTIRTTRRPFAVEPRLLLALGLLGGAAVCAATALTGAAGFYPGLATLLLAFGACMVLATITWTTLFLTAVPDGVVGVRTGINSAVFQMGGTLGSLLPATLLIQFGSVAYARLLEFAGVAPEQVDAAVEALNTLIALGVDASGIPPEVAGRLMAGYELAYLDAFGRVLWIIALVCAAGAALAWVGFPRLRAPSGRKGEPA